MVITGLTRNIVVSVTTVSPQTLYLSAFTPRATALLKTCISQFSRNLVSRRKPIQFYMETYRSGHNGADSKSVSAQAPASSNLAVSAKDSLKVLSFKEFSLLSQSRAYCHRTCFFALTINVAINVCGCSHITMTEPILNHFHRHTVCEE